MSTEYRVSGAEIFLSVLVTHPLGTEMGAGDRT